MIIGFTGTQNTLTLEQFDVLYDQIVKMDALEAHHGD